MRRYFLSFVLLLSVSFAVHAADPLCTEYSTEYGTAKSGWHKSKSAACSALNGMSPSPDDTITAATVSNDGNWCDGTKKTGVWPFGTNYFSVGFVGRQVPCEEVCIPGPKGVVNITAGYHATPSTNGKLNPFIKVDPFLKQLRTDQGATMCYQGCKVGVAPPADDDFWISQVAGPNGLYRSSADVSIQGTSQQCSEASPDAVTPSAPAPACPGSTGSVNGAVVCLPSVSDSGVDMGGQVKRGNPPAGPVTPGKTDKERGEGPGGAGNGTGPAGANGGGATGGPATGSNNTPGGKGCNDGSKSPTPACSGKGELDADGTTDKPGEDKEQQACGSPGQPKCRIDETGTPGEVGADKYDSKLDGYKTDSKDAADQIKGSGSGIYDSWTDLFTAPPLATCEGFELPSNGGQSMGTINPCGTVEGIRTAMAYLWALSGFWLCLGWVKAANT